MFQNFLQFQLSAWDDGRLLGVRRVQVEQATLCKKAPSSHGLSKFLTFSPRRHQLFRSLMVNETSSENSSRQYGAIGFLTWRTNLKYIVRSILIKPSSDCELSAPFHLVDASSSAFFQKRFFRWFDCSRFFLHSKET